MRSALLAAALVATPTTALAADENAKPKLSAEEIQQKLNDPVEQAKVSGMIEALGTALMQMPVGPLVNAMAKTTGEAPKDIAPDATLGDLAMADGQNIPAEMASKVPMMMQMMGGMAKSLEAMKPMLEQMGKDLEKSVAEANAS